MKYLICATLLVPTFYGPNPKTNFSEFGPFKLLNFAGRIREGNTFGQYAKGGVAIVGCQFSLQ